MREIKGALASRIYDFRAEFYDIDSMGVMWHGNYVKCIESARCRLLDEVGFNYNAMRENGFAMPIIKMELKYIAPIFFNDDFRIRIDLIECESVLKFQYIFLGKSGKKLTLAQTSQVAVNMKNGESLYEIPRIFKEKLQVFLPKNAISVT